MVLSLRVAQSSGDYVRVSLYLKKNVQIFGEVCPGNQKSVSLSEPFTIISSGSPRRADRLV